MQRATFEEVGYFMRILYRDRFHIIGIETYRAVHIMIYTDRRKIHVPVGRRPFPDHIVCFYIIIYIYLYIVLFYVAVTRRRRLPHCAVQRAATLFSTSRLFIYGKSFARIKTLSFSLFLSLQNNSAPGLISTQFGIRHRLNLFANTYTHTHLRARVW